MSRIFSLLMLLLVSVCARGADWSPQDINLPIHNGYYVANPDSILSPEQVAALNNLCRRIDNQGVQVAVVVIGYTSSSLQDFTWQLYEKWGLGGLRNRGLLLSVMVSSHDWRFVSGYGVEAELPDARLARIGDEALNSRFSNGDFFHGIYFALADIYSIVKKPDAIFAQSEDTTALLGNNVVEVAYDSVESQPVGDDGNLVLYVWFCLLAFGAVLSYIWYSPDGKFNSIAEYPVDLVTDVSPDKSQAHISIPAYEYDDKWSVFAGHPLMRWLVVFVGYAIAVIISYIKVDDFFYVFLAHYAYAVYLSIAWCLLARRAIQSEAQAAHVNATHLSKPNAVVRHLIVLDAPALFYSKVFAPFFAIPFAHSLRRSLLSVVQSSPCPVCNAQLHSSSETYRPVSPSLLFEVERGVSSPSLFACDGGHQVVAFLPGPSRHLFHKCSACGTVALSKVSTALTVKPTFECGGSRAEGFVCVCCGHSESRSVEVPALKKYWLSGGGSGSGSSSSVSRGSSGGGHSGGGGAGGRW